MRSAEDSSTPHKRLGLPQAVLVRGKALLLFILLLFDSFRMFCRKSLERLRDKPVLGL